MKKLFVLISTMLLCIAAQADVCRIGGTTYASFADAFSAVKEGETVVLLTDTMLEESIVIADSLPAFTFDLNGHILAGDSLETPTENGQTGSVICNWGATLTIIDSDPTSVHEGKFEDILGAIITGGKGSKSSGQINGGGLFSKGEISVYGITFLDNVSDNGGGVGLVQAKAYFQYCDFIGNEASFDGGAIFLMQDTATFDNCVVKGNSSLEGGAISLFLSELTLQNNTVVTENSSTTNYPSAGVYTFGANVVIKGDVTITENFTNDTVAADLCLSAVHNRELLLNIDSIGEGSEIGVLTMDNDVPYYDGIIAPTADSAVAKCFFADNWAIYDVIYRDSALVFDSVVRISLTVGCDIEGGVGTVTGLGLYNYRDMVEMVATPAEGYEFTGWSNGETDSILTFRVVCDTAFTATFAKLPTSVEETAAEQFVAYAEGSTIVINGAEGMNIELYDMAGRMVGTVSEANETERIEVSFAGVYVIRLSDGRTGRVIVK